MIYSCTLFFNEFDLLDLKISEELDQVDQMIIVESNQTFRGNKKPLHLKDNPKYIHPKIKLVFLEDQFQLTDSTDIETIRINAIQNETIQRNAALNDIILKDDDIVISTDLDEIIVKEDFPDIIESTKEAAKLYFRHARIQMHNHVYKINLLVDTGIEREWRGAVASTGLIINSLPRLFEDSYKKEGRILEAFFKITLDGLRQCPQNYCPQISSNGRHFSFLSSPEQMAYKLQNYALPENQIDDKDVIINRINNLEHIIHKKEDGNFVRLKKVDIDSTYPKTILNNVDLWQKYIH
jgi:hypothetical protein